MYRDLTACLHSDSRGTSIKTRIETNKHGFAGVVSVIREAHPLKQGLKPNEDVTELIFSEKFERHIH